MTTLSKLEEAAETAAEVALGTAALLESAEAVAQHSRNVFRLLLKLIVVALIIAALAGAVAKMRERRGDQAGRAT